MVARRETRRLWRAADRPDFDGLLLLDSHAWVWLLEGHTQRLDPHAVALVEQAGSEGRLRVCDISFWEVANKASKKKLVLSVDAAVWLRRAERAPGIDYFPADRDTLIQSTRLPGSPPGDPADRILMSSALLNDAPLLTVDAPIITYAGAVSSIPVCDARP